MTTWIPIGSVNEEPDLGEPVFVHHQTAAAAQWTIQHNRGVAKEPTVLIDSYPGGSPVYPDVVFPDLNTALIIFPSPESGYAYM